MLGKNPVARRLGRTGCTGAKRSEGRTRRSRIPARAPAPAHEPSHVHCRSKFTDNAADGLYMGHRRGSSGIGGAGGHGPGDRLIIGKADALQPGGWLLRVDDLDSDRGKYELQFAISADQQKASIKPTPSSAKLTKLASRPRPHDIHHNTSHTP